MGMITMNMSLLIYSLTTASLLLTLVSGCKDSGCRSDAECKGTRVCEAGHCVEGGVQRPASINEPPPQSTTALAPPQQTATAQPVAPPAVPSNPCMRCATQEHFDEAMKKGRKCCPVIACRSDADCAEGRVCCRIPDGQLCADVARCASSDRVQSKGSTSREASCRNMCPGGEISHCYCVCMGECTDN
jgi:hypothetical protein